MSQAGIISTSSGPVPPSVATSFVTDSGTAVPAANVLNVLTNDTTANNNNGIQDTGSGSTVTILLTNRIQGTGTTIGATTTTLATFPLGAVPGAYNVEAQFVGFNPSTPAATGYNVLGTLRTDGATATLVSVPDETPIEDIVLIASDVNLVVSGNNLLLQAVGVAGLTINWNVVATYQFVS